VPRPEELVWAKIDNGEFVPRDRSRDDLLSRAAFPVKVHYVLKLVEIEGRDDVFGWLPHGRSFRIFKEKEFERVVLRRYLSSIKVNARQVVLRAGALAANSLTVVDPDENVSYLSWQLWFQPYPR
jgi:hypothetical protein